MVRALKQDLVTSGALARGTGPAALYEVDKVGRLCWCPPGMRCPSEGNALLAKLIGGGPTNQQQQSKAEPR